LGNAQAVERRLLRPISRFYPRYIKARYVEYTNATFNVVKERPESEKHLGLVGPLLRARVGEKIKVTFKNSLDAAK